MPYRDMWTNMRTKCEVKYETLSVFYGLITYAFKCHCDFNVYILSLSLILLSKSPFRVQITKSNILLTTERIKVVNLLPQKKVPLLNFIHSIDG